MTAKIVLDKTCRATYPHESCLEDAIVSYKYDDVYDSDVLGEIARKAMIEFAKQFIDAANDIIVPATAILPDTYGEELDAWYLLIEQFKSE